MTHIVVLGMFSPAHRDAVNPQAWLADAHGNTLALLAAGADAGIKRHVVAHHRNAGQRVLAGADEVSVGRIVGAAADQRALHRRHDVAFEGAGAAMPVGGGEWALMAGSGWVGGDATSSSTLARTRSSSSSTGSSSSGTGRYASAST